MRYLIPVVILIAAVAGCGGGGGGGPGTPLMPPGDIRESQPGDHWEYSVTGTVSEPAPPNAVFTVGNSPRGTCFDGGQIWTANFYGDSLTVLDAADGSLVETIPSSGNPGEILFDGEYVWVGHHDGTVRSYYVDRAVGGSLRSETFVGKGIDGLCRLGDYIWAVAWETNRLYKIDRGSGDQVLSEYVVGTTPEGICADGSFLWIVNTDDENVVRVSPQTGAILNTIHVGGHPTNIHFDGSYVWVSSIGENFITKIDPDTAQIVDVIGGVQGAWGFTSGAGYLWVSGAWGASCITKVDPDTGQIVEVIQAAEDVLGGCFDGTCLWFAVEATDQVYRHRATELGGGPGTVVWGTATATILSSTETSPISGMPCQICQIVFSLTDGTDNLNIVRRDFRDLTHKAPAGMQMGSDPVGWVDSPSAGYLPPLPTSIGVGSSYDSGTYHLTTGEVGRTTFIVTGVEQVSTPLGQFLAYKLSKTITVDGEVDIGSFWIYPPLGWMEVASETSVTADGVTFELQVQLTATNVPH